MSQILAWICLVLVASTSAYGLQLTAAAMMPSVDAALQVTAATFTRRVWLVAIDPVTGDRAQVECNILSYSFASNVVLVDAKDFPAFAQTCNHPTATTMVLPDATVRVTQGQQQSMPGTFGAIGNNPMLAAMQQRNRASAGR
jgi:hypothetical protein